MNKLSLAIIVALISAQSSFSISGTVSRIFVQIATDAELAENVLPRGMLVQREADPKDLRIGDGTTVGGISLWNFAALTNPPTLFPHDVQMDHHHVRLDNSYSINAESGRLTAWYGTNAVWTVVATSSTADNVLLSVAPEGTSMAFTVASESDDVVVEVCSSLADPVWTAVAFGFERLTPLTVKITVPNPPVGEMQYVRVITGGGDVGMVVSLPLSVPSLVVGGADVTAGAISNWNAAHGWGDHGAAGYATGTPVYAETDAAAMGALAALPTNDWIEAYGWGDHGAAGYLVSETIGNAQRITLGSGDVETVPAYGEILFGYPEESKYVSLRFIDNDVVFGPTNSHLEAWSLTDGTNTWRGRINDYEAARIASLPATFAAGTTNYFIRPDGGTNTISFDATGNMIFAVDGATALTIRTNGNVGVKHGGSGTYSLYVSGDIYATSRMRALDFRASDASSYFLDPNGESMLASANFDGSLTATQGVTKIILPTATNGLVSGTLWNNLGTVSVMP